MVERELTPAQAANRIGCTRACVYRMIRFGQLEARRESTFKHSLVWIRESEVEAAAANYKPHPSVKARTKPTSDASRRGKLAAKVFPLFEARKTLAQIVIELELAPDLVRSLYEEWMTPIEATSAIRQAREQAEAERKEQARQDRLNGQQEWRAHKERMRRIEAQAKLEPERSRFVPAPKAGGIK